MIEAISTASDQSLPWVFPCVLCTPISSFFSRRHLSSWIDAFSRAFHRHFFSLHPTTRSLVWNTSKQCILMRSICFLPLSNLTLLHSLKPNGASGLRKTNSHYKAVSQTNFLSRQKAYSFERGNRCHFCLQMWLWFPRIIKKLNLQPFQGCL